MRRDWISVVALSGIVAFGAYACGSNDSASTTNTAPADAGKDSGSTPVVDAGRDAGPVEGSSCANAITADLGVEVTGSLDAEGQKVFYAVNVKAGDFLFLGASTAATVDTGEEIVDTTISIFNADGSKLLASVDDAFPRITTDADMYYRAPADATLCVQVTDYGTWSGGTSTVAADANYTFFAGKIDPAAATVTFDAEPNDTNAAPQVGRLKAFTQSPGGYTHLMGVLSSATDVDTYKFTVPAGAKSISVAVPPVGAPLTPATSSYGSTMARFVVTVKKMDGTIVAELAPPAGNVEKMSDGLSAPVEAGDYLVTFSRPAGTAAGANDFYATTLDFGATNTPETEALGANTNDTLATAQALALTADATNAKIKDGYVLGFLPAGDVADSFSFPVAVNDSIALSCGSIRNGSGLEGVKVELFVGGVSKQAETETALADLAWSTSRFASKPAVTATSAGTAVVQVSATGRSATNTGVYFLCGVHTTAP
jgi:hypothetical protein